VNIYVEFIVDGEFATPDASSTSYTVYMNDGSAHGTIANVPLSVAAGATGANVRLVTTDIITKDAAKKSERRLLSVAFKVGGRQYTAELPFVLVDAHNLSISPADVRSYLGVNEVQLPDRDIDLVEAYWATEDVVGASNLATALSAGTRVTSWANKAVLYAAALHVIPSLRLRLFKEETQETATLIRDKVDWQKLTKDTSELFSQAVKNAVPAAVTSVTPNLLLVTTETDPVTGA
jgi:hypothetical protein